MTNIKATKRALGSSVLALFLCFAMLLGTTFAWFTDSVTSANNVITAGNLDIKLEYAKEKNDAGDLIWNEVDGNPVFDTDALWEPGRVEVVYLKVSNIGSLALKYQLRVNINSEVEGTNVAGNKFKLSEYLVFKVVETKDASETYTRDEAINVDVPEQELTQYNNAETDLAVNGIHYIALIVYMPEEVGNDANYRGDAIPSIDLGINLYATQYNSESDSFGSDYDAEADMIDAILAEGGIIIMDGDRADEMVVSEGADVQLNMGNSTLNNTLTNNGTVTVEGGKIVVDGNNALYNEGDATIKDVTMEMTNSTGYISNSRTDGSVTIYENVTATSTGGGVNVWEGEAVFKSGTITTNSTSTSARHMFYVANGATLTIEEGEFFFSPTNLTRKGSYICADTNATVIVKGGVFHKPSTRTAPVQELNGSNVVIEGGTFYWDPSEWVADGYKVVKDETAGTWTVEPAATDDATLNDAITNADSNTTIAFGEGEYTLPSMKDKTGITLIGAADGSTVIGGENTSTGFGSNFGKDTTIKNITFSGSSNGVRWSYANGGTSTFENCTFAGDSTYGFHIDSSNGATFIFKNCTFVGFNAFAGDLANVVFDNCTFLSNGNYGHTNIWSVGEFNNCTWGDNTSVSPAGSGKLYFDGVEESYHHEFIGSAESLFAFAKSVNEGGDSWNGQKVVLVADIDLENEAWTPIGQTGATEFKGIFDGQDYTIKNLNVDSSAQTGGHYSSGLFGWAESGVTIQNVKVDGAKVIGNHNVAVIVGYTYSGKIANCHVTNAEIVCTHANGDACGDKAGTIVGYAGDESRFTNCSASDSTVKAGRDAGQLIGCGYNVSVSNCTATNVTVTAGGDCTGANINNTIIGRVMG